MDDESTSAFWYSIYRQSSNGSLLENRMCLSAMKKRCRAVKGICNTYTTQNRENAIGKKVLYQQVVRLVVTQLYDHNKVQGINVNQQSRHPKLEYQLKSIVDHHMLRLPDIYGGLRWLVMESENGHYNNDFYLTWAGLFSFLWLAAERPLPGLMCEIADKCSHFIPSVELLLFSTIITSLHRQLNIFPLNMYITLTVFIEKCGHK